MGETRHMTAKKFEYSTRNSWGSKDLLDWLNHLGSEGWELIELRPDGSGNMDGLFKREL